MNQLGSHDGYCSYFGIAGSIWSHGCASEVKMSICGRNQLGSSRLPATIPTIGDGVSDSAPVKREPQSAQNPRLCLPRLRLSVKWYCNLPRVNLNASEGTITKGTKGPPER